jgi:membrane protein required for colicin V production
MTLVDWAVVLIMLAAVLAGLAQGFFRSVCSVANTISFLLIALLVMGLVGFIGNLLAKAFRMLGLGWLDGIAGAIFGFFQGIVLVVICLLVMVAFFPQVHWVTDATLPRMFFGACHVSSNVTPSELGERVRSGLKIWESQSPRWMHPGPG